MPDRPWMTALEMQFAALSIARKHVASFTDGRSLSQAARLDSEACMALVDAIPFAWSREVTAAVWRASQSVPTSTIFDPDVIPGGDARSFWWWFDEPLTSVPLKLSDEDLADGVCALLITFGAGLVRIIDFRLSARFHAPVTTGVFVASVNASLSDLEHKDTLAMNPFGGGVHKRTERAVSLTRLVMAASAWINQRIALIGSGHIERHHRKQLAREHDAHLSDVKVITLRRGESQPRIDSSDEPVEWSCRWIVNGHWRNQFHPSSGKHELKYILPYVKGPADKPLKVPTHTVYAVTR